MKSIIIVKPHGNTGGALMLCLLCRLLRDKNIDAKLFYIESEPKKDTLIYKFWINWFKYTIRYYVYYILVHTFKFDNRRWKEFINKPIEGTKRIIFPFFKKKQTIVVYPEQVYGNFLNAKNVVRWLLFSNPYLNNREAYGRNDLVICYRKIYNDWNLNKKGLTLKLNYFDSKCYYRYNYGVRKGCCYFLRKGKNRRDVPFRFDGPILDDLYEEEKVRILNECKYCYSYDTQTFYMQIAAVCGCIPIVVMEPGKRKEDYAQNGDVDKFIGIAYGDSKEEIDMAIKGRQDLIARLNFDKDNSDNVDSFLKMLASYFGCI